MMDLSFDIANGLPDNVRMSAIETCKRYNVDWNDCYGIEGDGDPVVFLMYKRNDYGSAYVDESTDRPASYRIERPRLPEST